MDPTERLYYTDAYLTSFDARIVDRSDSGRRVYLDRTAFYPTSGGQPFDTGELEGIAVVDVVEEDGRIAHLLAAPLEAERVTGRVDWARRFDHMQQHSGQHLLSAVLAEGFHFQTVSVHFGRESSTLDLDAGRLTSEQVAEAESRANALVAENRKVDVTFEDAATTAGLRKATTRSGPLRVISIERLDRSACGGTHVRATGEIGPILIRKVERVKQQVRLEFLCGGRAVRRARSDQEILARLAAAASATAEELPQLLEAERAELKAANAARRELEAEVFGYRARALYEAASPDPDGVRRLIQTGSQGSIEQLRGMALACTSLPHSVFVGSSDTPPTILLAAAADSGVDAAALLKPALAEVGGRGGGSPRLAQGTVPDAAALARVLARVGA